MASGDEDRAGAEAETSAPVTSARGGCPARSSGTRCGVSGTADTTLSRLRGVGTAGDWLVGVSSWWIREFKDIVTGKNEVSGVVYPEYPDHLLTILLDGRVYNYILSD